MPTQNITTIAAARVIPGDGFVIRSAYGDRVWPVTGVWGTTRTTIEFETSQGTVTRDYRSSASVEVVACEGDR